MDEQGGKHKIILFCVVGDDDCNFIKILVKKLNLDIETRFFMTYGKDNLFQELTTFVSEIKGIEKIIVLYDVENDADKIPDAYEKAKNNLDKFVPVDLFPVVPNLEAWKRAGLINCTVKDLRTVSLEIEFYIELARERNQSFKEFVKKLISSEL